MRLGFVGTSVLPCSVLPGDKIVSHTRRSVIRHVHVVIDNTQGGIVTLPQVFLTVAEV